MNKLSSVILSIILALVLVIGVAFVLRGIVNYKDWGEKIIGVETNDEATTDETTVGETNDNMIIGGDRDEGDCLVAAGYSWCEPKDKCLRVWEEPCTCEDALRNYLNANLSELSPEPEVLGGTFYVTEIEIISDTQATVDYEDGHMAYRASVLFTYEDEVIEVKKISLLAENPPPVGNDNIGVIELKKLFAAKYDLMEEDIRIEITDDRGEYLKGQVWFFPEGPGNSGIFLAAMVDGQYELSFDGNGIYTCAAVEPYGFPADMISGCVEE